MNITQLAPGERISRPGLYQCDAETYFADPCPEPSLNQSLAKIILDQSASHARQEHPRLTPDPRDESAEPYSRNKAIGNAAHLLLIGRGKRLAVADFDDWRSAEARKFKVKAFESNCEPILAEHYADAEKVAAAARRQLVDCGWGDLFSTTEGHGEVVAAWQENGLWFRTMIDWLPNLCEPVDLKTTGGTAAPHAIESKLCDDGWDIQAAMIKRGLDVLDPDNIGRRKFRYVLIENYPPYALTPVEFSESVLAIGHRRLDAAAQIWARAVKANKFDGYPTSPVVASFPPWGEAKWMERELQLADSGAITNDWTVGIAEPPRDAAKPKQSVIMAG